MEKHLFKLATMLIAMLMSLAMIMSCSKDDDEDHGNSSSSTSYNNGSSNSTTPQYEKKTCVFCRGTGDCFSCKGSGKCSSCKGTGQTGTGRFVITCITCRGDRTCVYCKGVGICTDCDGVGYKMVEVTSDNGGSSNSSSTDEYISVKAVKITAVTITGGDWSYSASKVNMYKKQRADGKWVLYSSSKSLIGTASINSDRKCGDTNVSGYTYSVLTNVSLYSKTYYYFN